MALSTFVLEARLSEGLLNVYQHLWKALILTGFSKYRDSPCCQGKNGCFPWIIPAFLATHTCCCGHRVERVPKYTPLRRYLELNLRFCCFQQHNNLIPFFGPQIRRGYPPNLSISFSGGKETKEDFPSNGERTGSSPAPNLPSLGWQDMWCAGAPFSRVFPFPKSVGTRPFPVEGDRPVWKRMALVGCLPGVELLVSATLNGWYAPSKAKYA